VWILGQLVCISPDHRPNPKNLLSLSVAGQTVQSFDFADIYSTFGLEKLPEHILHHNNSLNTTQDNKPQRKVVGDSLLMSFIKTCRSHADVLNMAYINHMCGNGQRWMSDIVGRKKPIRDKEKVIQVINSILEYCDEVEEMRGKIERLKHEIEAQV
jgi:uncharacterized protein YeeX (DUF496 family)